MPFKINFSNNPFKLNISNKPGKGKTLLIAAAVLALSANIAWGIFVDSVPNGHVGVAVSKIDGEVRKEVLGVGYNPIGLGTTVKHYPVFTQTYTWTKAATEGSPTDESMTFQAGAGVTINTDLSISYNIDPNAAPVLYQKYRRDYEELTNQVIRNEIRNALNSYGTKYSAEGLLAGDKNKLADEVLSDLNKKFNPYGLRFESFGFVNELRLPASIQNAINEKVKTTQEAMQREAQLRKTQADAAITLAQAEASAQAKLKAASAEAQSLSVVGEALRKNPEAAELRVKTEWIQKWNGALPTTELGSGSQALVKLK